MHAELSYRQALFGKEGQYPLRVRGIRLTPDSPEPWLAWPGLGSLDSFDNKTKPYQWYIHRQWNAAFALPEVLPEYTVEPLRRLTASGELVALGPVSDAQRQLMSLLVKRASDLNYQGKNSIPAGVTTEHDFRALTQLLVRDMFFRDPTTTTFYVSGRTDFSKELPNVDGDVYAAVAKYDRRLIDGDHVIYAPIADRTTQMWETARQAIQHVVNGDEQAGAGEPGGSGGAADGPPDGEEEEDAQAQHNGAVEVEGERSAGIQPDTGEEEDALSRREEGDEGRPDAGGVAINSDPRSVLQEQVAKRQRTEGSAPAGARAQALAASQAEAGPSSDPLDRAEEDTARVCAMLHAKDKSIRALQNSHTQLQLSHTQLQASHAVLERDHAALQAFNAELQQSNAALQVSAAQHSAELRARDESIRELREANERMTQEIAELRSFKERVLALALS